MILKIVHRRYHAVADRADLTDDSTPAAEVNNHFHFAASVIGITLTAHRQSGIYDFESTSLTHAGACRTRNSAPCDHWGKMTGIHRTARRAQASCFSLNYPSFIALIVSGVDKGWVIQ